MRHATRPESSTNYAKDSIYRKGENLQVNSHVAFDVQHSTLQYNFYMRSRRREPYWISKSLSISGTPVLRYCGFVWMSGG